MFEQMRRVFGPVAVSVIIGAIALVFVFFGIYNPRTGGGRGGAVAATVNGDGIPMQEFSREYQRRTEMFANIMKGKVDPNLLKQLRVGEQVVEDLIRRKLVAQAADKMGIVIGDAEIRDKIKEMPYFKDKAGNFDVSRYNQILDANHYSPAVFEDMVREDLQRERVSDFVRSRAKVSDKEVESEFLVSEDRRQVDYLVLNPETGKKFVIVGEKDIDEALKDKQGLEAAKLHYERTKMNYMKPAKKVAKGKKDEAPAKPEFLSFDEVKRKVVADMLRERRHDEIAKIDKEMADELYAKAKSGEAALKAAAKAKGLEVKTSSKFNRQQNFVPGVGDFPELVQDAFKDPSPLSQGPKLYESKQAYAIVMNLAAFKPNLADLPKEREQLGQTVMNRKAESMYQQWLGDLRSHAKVSVNKAISEPAGAADEAPTGAPADSGPIEE